MPPLLPRAAPAATGTSARAIGALLDLIEARGLECHSLMVVRHGHVVAEGWWAPYSAGRPHLLYSLTKSFTSIAVGLAIDDGLLSLDDRVADVLPEHIPAGGPEQGHRITVRHLLSMTAGHGDDSLAEAWRLEPGDLTKGFLRVPFPHAEGTRHTYDNATTYVLARMVERVTGRGLPELLDERLFAPMGIDHAEWDRVASGAAFGFHGLHLTTEAVAAFGELLLRGGGRLVPRSWVELATRQHIAIPGEARGYGYQFWTSPHGFYGDGAFGQQCVVVPSQGLVIVVTSACVQENTLPDLFWESLLPALDSGTDDRADTLLAERLRGLSLPPVPGAADPGRPAAARIVASAPDAPLPDGTPVVVEPATGGWLVRLGASLTIATGHGTWRESAPLGRPVLAAGAWQDDTFAADLFVITTPHRVRLTVDAATGTATAEWSTVPLTKPDLELHLRSPLTTRPDVA